MRTHFMGSAQTTGCRPTPGEVAVELVIRDVAARGVVTRRDAAGGRHGGRRCRGCRHDERRCDDRQPSAVRPRAARPRRYDTGLLLADSVITLVARCIDCLQRAGYSLVASLTTQHLLATSLQPSSHDDIFFVAYDEASSFTAMASVACPWQGGIYEGPWQGGHFESSPSSFSVRAFRRALISRAFRRAPCTGH